MSCDTHGFSVSLKRPTFRIERVTHVFQIKLAMALTGSGGSGSYLQVTARLAEFDTPQAKIDARQNLELQNIDGGTFN